jgi:hypothetical protein
MRTTTSVKTSIVLCVMAMLSTASTALAAGPSELQQCAARLQASGQGYGSMDSDNSLSGYDMAVGRCMEYINRPHGGQPRRSW